MGYIDCDTHVWETEKTWAYLRPEEEQYRPAIAEVASGTDVPYRFWLVQDQRMVRNDGASPHQTDQHRTLFPEGTKGLDDIDARLREMDHLGVDVQVLFPSVWLNVGVRDPIIGRGPQAQPQPVARRGHEAFMRPLALDDQRAHR